MAATVNGQPISESMVERGLKTFPPAQRAEARPDLIHFLIDNLLVEQYLVQMKITVEKAEVDKRLEEMKEEVKGHSKEGKEGGFPAILEAMGLTEAELREHIMADIRWDKYAASQATDKALREMFESNKEMFDGSMVRARHILLTTPPDQAQAQLSAIKKQIEDKVAEGLAKLPAATEALAREKARTQLLDEAFAAQAREKSACPSKAQGGDVDWFYRAGQMVEPFAKAAFSLKPYQLSDIVKTPFGHHLILVTERKAPEKEVKFEDVQKDVKEVYCERLRDNTAAQVKAKSKIVIFPAQ